MIITLDNGTLRLTVNPDVGGAVVRFDRLTEHGPEPVMRPGSEDESDPNRLAMYPLVPWSNRIGGGGFAWRGQFNSLEPNLPGEALPIHGDGWQRAWQVVEQDDVQLRLGLRSSHQPPFDYRAELSYCLEANALEVRLAITHLGDTPALYGLGLHPWFPRSAEVRLEASAEGVWEVDSAQLPTEWRRLDAADPWNFVLPAPLPSDRIDNLFSGWGGRAVLRWPERGMALGVYANTSRYLLFSPGSEADFFCFEPVSHDVDAYHFDDPQRHGLVELGKGERHLMCCRFCLAGQ
ncbi:aldose 1-epimerase [Halomonas salipaludis]|uniref:Aldose epimerase n=1 Tax=Halomonas salipaludis TaxID=2032625 RepID=A0A2A2ENG1_9GAMM|nr:aldose 1-epimerase [Halomonas salipaludis]PAU74024.1 aldose epimerase [Halomonas salipaludis]